MHLSLRQTSGRGRSGGLNMEPFLIIMSKRMACILLAYGGALAALGFLFQKIAPASAKIALITAMAGGGLSVLWSIVAFAGHKRRLWAILTVIAVTIVLLTQVVQTWLDTSTLPAARLVVTLTFLLTMSMLLYLFHGERPPEFYDHRAAHRSTPFSQAERPPSPDAERRR